MSKHVHEFRDPIHGFIRVDSKERLVVDSRQVQRLRHIHQLALTNLLYPGATHRRFEHSLGVMDLAGRVYDTVTDPNNILHDAVIRTEIDLLALDLDFPDSTAFQEIRLWKMRHETALQSTGQGGRPTGTLVVGLFFSYRLLVQSEHFPAVHQQLHQNRRFG